MFGVGVRFGKLVWRGLKHYPSHALPAFLKEDERYLPGGYACWKCGWLTDRKDYSGRQAVRGHLRTHVRERKAWSRPLTGQTVFLLVIVVGGVTAWLGYWPRDSGTPVEAGGLVAVTATAVLLAVTASGVFMTLNGLSSPDPWSARLALAGRISGSALFVGAAAMSAGLVVPGLGDAWLIAAIVAGLSTPWLAAYHGMVRYRLRRRKRKPSGYVPVHVAADDEAEGHLRKELHRQLEEREAERRKKARGRSRPPDEQRPATG